MKSSSKIGNKALIGIFVFLVFLILASCSKPVGSIEINSTPTGADVFLDDSTTGLATDCILEEVSEGEHTIKLVLTGYSDWDTTVTVERNDALAIAAVLGTATGNIEVNSDPKGAAIWLDGDSTGHVTDFVLVDVTAGSHVIKLTKEGYADWVDTVTVIEDQTTVVDAELQLPPGSFVWSYRTNGAVISSPAVGLDGTIYVGSEDDYLYAIDAVDGSLAWSAQTGGAIFSSPAIGADGTIYVGSMDGALYAINASDGSVAWSRQTGGAIFSSPAIGSDGTIYVGSFDGNLYAINPNNTVKWSSLLGDTETVWSSPAIGSDGNIYVGASDGAVYAINAVDGSEAWSYPTGGAVISSPGIGDDGIVYIGSADGYLYALNPIDGTLRWSYLTGDTVRSSPVVGSDGTIYVGSRDGYLYAINPDNTLKWQYFLSAASFVHSPPALGSDATIYVGGADYYLYAINTSDGTVKWRYDTGGMVNSAPAISQDGVIYVGTENDYLYAIQGSGTLASSPWPMFHHNLQHTGRAF